MDDRLQRRVQRYGWDAAVPHYDSGWGDGLRAAHDVLLSMVDLSPGLRVLETACGTGLVTLRAAVGVMPGGSVLATDISGKMVEETARRVQEKGYDHVHVTRMDGENLTVEDDTYDVALCALGLMYVPDPEAALAEMRRVVKPGSNVVATVWGERRNCGWADIFPIVDSVVKSEVCPLFFRLGAPGAIVRAMESTGLERTEELRHDVQLYWPNEEALLVAMIDGGAVALAAKRFSPETRDKVNKSFLSSVSKYRNPDGSYMIPGEFVTAVGQCG